MAGKPTDNDAPEKGAEGKHEKYNLSQGIKESWK